MAKLIDIMDLIGLNIGMLTFKLREIMELKMDNLELNPSFIKQINKSLESENRKRIGAEIQ